jgi:hypothetical protein
MRFAYPAYASGASRRVGEGVMPDRARGTRRTPGINFVNTF